MTNISKRNYVRMIAYSIFALIVLVTLAISGTKSSMQYQNQLEISYQQSLAELNECMESIDTDLTKSLYSGSYGEIYDLSRDLYAQCSTAKNAISRLPIRQMELGNAYKFLSQAGDYAQYIGSKVERGEAISDEEHKNLKVLLDYAQKFESKTGDMVSIVEAGGRITDNEVKSDEPIATSSLSNDFSVSAKAFNDFPTLLYDGPFSDQVLNKESQLIKNADVINKNECKKIAARALDTTTDKLSYEGDEQGSIPCYTFNFRRYTISVTKQGGYIRSILYSGAIDNKSISNENACNLAIDYLNKIGYKDMQVSYYEVSNNICTVNCAYNDSGITVYSDLIKVGVSMEDGKVVTMDSTTYLTNHTERKTKKPVLTQEQAMAKISKYLDAKQIKQCIIPKPSGAEKHCYEVICESKDTGEKALVYINAQNGNEEDIMLMIETENGSLVK